MEMQTIMSSSPQMPQTLADIATADDRGSLQGKPAQSPGFGLFLDLWAGTGGKDLSQIPLQQTTKGSFSMAAASADDAVRLLQGQTGADAETSVADKGNAITNGPTPGLKSTDTLENLCPEGARNLQASSENLSVVQIIQGLPVLPGKGQSTFDSSQPEGPRETNKEKPDADSVWMPLFAAGNLLIAGNYAKPSPVPAEASQLQGSAQQEDEQELSVNQPGNPVQTAAVAAQGDFLAGLPPATLQQAPDPVPVSGNLSPASLLQGATLYQTALSGSESLSGKPGSDPATVVNTGMNAAIPQAERDNQGSGNMLFSGTKGINDKVIDASGPEKGVSVHGAGPATTAKVTPGTLRIGEPAENATRTKTFEAAMQRKGDPISMPDNVAQAKPPAIAMQEKGDPISVPDNVVQGKPQAIADPASASTGVNPERVEIVFAAEQEEFRKEPGGAPALKSQAGKAADSAPTVAFAANAAELRYPGESRTAAPAPETRDPSGNQIFSQVRDKLDANCRASDNGQITLKLHPEELGELKINMRMEDHSLKVEIVTQNPSVKEALMQNLDTLKDTLARQNIAMDRFDVSADPRQGFFQGGRDERQMAQENRGVNNGFQYSAKAEEDAAPIPSYSWESENSLVNLML